LQDHFRGTQTIFETEIGISLTGMNHSAQASAGHQRWRRTLMLVASDLIANEV